MKWNVGVPPDQPLCKPFGRESVLAAIESMKQGQIIVGVITGLLEDGKECPMHALIYYDANGDGVVDTEEAAQRTTAQAAAAETAVALGTLVVPPWVGKGGRTCCTGQLCHQQGERRGGHLPGLRH